MVGHICRSIVNDTHSILFLVTKYSFILVHFLFVHVKSTLDMGNVEIILHGSVPPLRDDAPSQQQLNKITIHPMIVAIDATGVKALFLRCRANTTQRVALIGHASAGSLLLCSSFPKA